MWADKWTIMQEPIHGLKRRKENQLLSLKHPCWLPLVKHVNEVHGNMFSPLFEKKIRGQKHAREVVKNRNSIQT